MRITVYCSSSAQINKLYFEATRQLALAFLQENIEIIIGGGAIGLMGALTDVYIDNGGKIKGIMPKFMKEVEWAHKGISDFVFTDTMHERKEKFLENTDAIVALPGGSGTLEELIEVITLKRLGKFFKPIIILNTNGFYDPLQQLFENSVKEKFMHEKHLDMWEFVKHPKDVIPAIKNSTTWTKEAIQFATNR